MVTLLQIIVAFLAGTYLLYRYQPQHARLSLPSVIGAYGFRIVLGCIYGYVMQRYYPGDDTNLIHQQGLIEYRMLIDHPHDFFATFLNTAPFSSENSFWMKVYYALLHWEATILLKLLALFNCFSGGNYFINLVFLNIFSFKGIHYLYAIGMNLFPDRRRLFFVVLFCFPTITFWLSGIRAEALLIYFLGLSFYQLHFFPRKTGLAWAGLAGVLVMRNQLFISLLPGLVAFYASANRPRPARIFLGCYVAAAALVFCGSLLPQYLNALHFLQEKQADFKALNGNTVYFLPDLQPTAGSLIKVLPYGIYNTVFRPLFMDAKGVFQYAASFETLLVLVIIVYAAFRKFRIWRMAGSKRILLLCLFGALAGYALIGLIVPFPGAIIRYRSIPELLLLFALLPAVKNFSFIKRVKTPGKLNTL